MAFPSLPVAMALALLPAAPRPLQLGLEDQALGPHTAYLLDHAGTLGFEAVLERARGGTLADCTDPVRSFGPTEAALWMYARVDGGPRGGLVAVTWDRPVVEHLDLWVVRADRTDRFRGGLAVPAAERTLRHAGPYHHASLALPSGERPVRYFVVSASIMSAFGALYLAALLGIGPATATTLGGFPVALWAGGVVLLLSLFERVDVERGQARQQLEREERFRVAFRTSPEAISITAVEDGTYLMVNQGFTRISGYAEAELLGRSSLAVSIWADPADRARLVRELQERGRCDNLEARFQAKGGRTIVGLMSAQRITLGGRDYLLAVTRDITDRKAAEDDRDRLAEELRQSQKLEAIGRLAGGVAHDFNNLLTVMGTNVSLALLDLPDPDPSRVHFREIGDAVERAAQLTRQLLAFSRRQVLEPRSLDLLAHVGGMRDLLRRLLGEDVELSVGAAGQAPRVLADPHQVEQVVVNLAVNARDAMPRGGRIAISARAVEVVAGPGDGPGRRPGSYVALLFEDDGEGMTPEVRARAFEPFFTTKRGKGTGLGLSTVYGIVAQHGGFVEVDSAPGKGTTFRVHLPVAPASAQPEAAAPPRELELPRGTETILLAEDEPAVRRVAAALLTRLGYHVLEAHDGEEALVVAARAERTVDLLLTDVVMPRLNGRQLAERFRERFPAVPVIFMSGYTQEVIDRAGVLEPGLRLVQKPFDPARLAHAVRAALAGR